MLLFCVLASGSLERLYNVSLDQAGEFVQMYPKVHIFEGDDIVDDEESD